MENTRLTQLFELLKTDPDDPFLLYGIGLEYAKTDTTKALEYFSKVMNDHPYYHAVYYHAGKLLEKIGDKTKAGEVYQKGMEISRSKNQSHALRELQQAYNLLFEDEEDY